MLKMKIYSLLFLLLSSGSYSMPTQRNERGLLKLLKLCFPNPCPAPGTDFILPIYCYIFYDQAHIPCKGTTSPPMPPPPPSPPTSTTTTTTTPSPPTSPPTPTTTTTTMSPPTPSSTPSPTPPSTLPPTMSTTTTTTTPSPTGTGSPPSIKSIFDIFPRGVDEEYYDNSILDEQTEWEIIEKAFLNNTEYAKFRVLDDYTLQRISDEEELN